MRIYVRDVWKVYGGSVIALRGVSFELVDSRLVILAGPNGAGKTTLVRVMDGELSPTKGYVSIDGLSPDEARVKGLFGVMPQEAELHEYLTVREYLYYLSLIKGLSRSDARREVNRVIDDFMLHEYAKRKIRELSGGFKRRVLLAQAFLGTPQLLFLDEPTVGLDPEMRVKLWRVITKYLNDYGATAILVTHYLDEVKGYADKVLLLHKGKLVFMGTPKELLDRVGYRYRVRIRLTNKSEGLDIPVTKYFIRDSEVEVFVHDDEELLNLMYFIRTIKDIVAEVVIDRPSLEESYMEVLRLGEVT